MTKAARSKFASEECKNRIALIREKFDTQEIQGMFDLGWQLLYNYPERDCAIEPIFIGKNAPTLGIADHNISGYTPTNVYFHNEPTWDQLRDIATWFNTDILGLSNDDALEITMSSYR